MRLPSGGWAGTVSFTVLLTFLVALATVQTLSYALIVNLAAIAAGVAFFFFVFPGSGYFAIAFANSLAIYMCIFVFFKETNFAAVSGLSVAVGFLLPIAAFVVGTWVRREAIRSIVTAEHVRDERHFGRLLLWLLPVSLVGAATFFLPALAPPPPVDAVAFVAAMAIIAAIVFLVSADVCAFLLDSGLLFEEFFGRVRRLVVPAFAFLTFYSLLVIVFAVIYRVIDRYSDAAHFLVEGSGREIGFSESVYFSVVSMSTVGYGDILPATDVHRRGPRPGLRADRARRAAAVRRVGNSELRARKKDIGAGSLTDCLPYRHIQMETRKPATSLSFRCGSRRRCNRTGTGRPKIVATGLLRG